MIKTQEQPVVEICNGFHFVIDFNKDGFNGYH